MGFDDDDDGRKGIVVFFDKDILKRPCFRNTFMYSIISYLAVGATTFLFTSKPRFSSHCGMASFMVVGFGYYANCRIEYAKQKFQLGQIQAAVQKAVAMEGVEDDDTDSKSKPILEDV